MRIAAIYPILKLCPDLTCWRVHPSQEHQNRANNNLYFHTGMRALNALECPLNKKDREIAIGLIKRRSVKNILNMALKKGNYKLALAEFKKSRHSLTELLKALN